MYLYFDNSGKFTDSRKGFIIGEDQPDENPVRKGIILKTIDGGSDFELCNTPHLLAEKNAGLLQIDMLNNSIGAVLGNYYGTTVDTSLILTTQDGGKTWYESDLHVPLRAEAISQPDENTFYIAGDTSAYGGVLYKFTQKPQNLPVIELPGIEISLFPNPNDGILHLKISSIRPADLSVYHDEYHQPDCL